MSAVYHRAHVERLHSSSSLILFRSIWGSSVLHAVPEESIQRINRIARHVWQHMAVDIERHADCRVPKHLRHDLRMDTPQQQQGGRGMPQVVESYRGQPRFGQEWSEVPLQGVISPDRNSDGIGEDEAPVLPRLFGDIALGELTGAVCW